VISQKAVSKAEGRIRWLSDVSPGERARKLAAELGKDPALVELILAESRSVIRAERGVLIVETASGWICANAGIDASNVPGDDAVVLLPEDPDASARRIRGELRAAAGVAPAVVVSDSFGRPWRIGQADVAIGCAGIEPIDDWRGRPDGEGRELAATAVAVADQLAAAADLTRDKTSGAPVVHIRGATRHVIEEDGPGAAGIQRPAAKDLFR
jgi:coenzyme F420-0:L-glutamate ligase/coenzyme F420-1:gamma-L-glutamate ligase